MFCPRISMEELPSPVPVKTSRASKSIIPVDDQESAAAQVLGEQPNVCASDTIRSASDPALNPG